MINFAFKKYVKQKKEEEEEEEEEGKVVALGALIVDTDTTTLSTKIESTSTVSTKIVIGCPTNLEKQH